MSKNVKYTISITGHGTEDEIISSLEEMIKTIREHDISQGSIIEDGIIHTTVNPVGSWG